MSKSRRGSNVTIVDVATAAGVSPATVSRVLNGTTKVDDERARRVHAAATKLGYVPNVAARALRRQRSSIWAAIVADIENPFFTSVIRGIEDVAHREGMRLVVCNTDEDASREVGYVEIAARERMAGVVISATSATEYLFDDLEAAGIPVVVIDRRPTQANLNTVLVDNRRGGALAAQQLLDAGYGRVACVTGPKGVSTADERLAGFSEVVRAAGQRLDRSLVRRANFKDDGGYRATASLLDAAKAPDAIFVANNPMTAGAVRAIRDAGLKVGADVGLVGFDDSPWMTLTSPEITVVVQPSYEIGQTAAGLLLEPASETAREILLAPKLIDRESSCR